MTFSTILLVVLLVLAALWDIRKRRIPNQLSAAIFLVAILHVLVGEGWQAALSALGAAIFVFSFGWLLWTSGKVGGGDVKLAAAAATAMGFAHLSAYLLFTALGGAFLAGICFFSSNRNARKEMLINFKVAAAGVMPEPSIKGGNGRVSVPYGVACVVASLLIIFLENRG